MSTDPRLICFKQISGKKKGQLIVAPKNAQLKQTIPANIPIRGHAKRGVVTESFQSPIAIQS